MVSSVFTFVHVDGQVNVKLIFLFCIISQEVCDLKALWMSIRLFQKEAHTVHPQADLGAEYLWSHLFTLRTACTKSLSLTERRKDCLKSTFILGHHGLTFKYLWVKDIPNMGGGDETLLRCLQQVCKWPFKGESLALAAVSYKEKGLVDVRLGYIPKEWST